MRPSRPWSRRVKTGGSAFLWRLLRPPVSLRRKRRVLFPTSGCSKIGSLALKETGPALKCMTPNTI